MKKLYVLVNKDLPCSLPAVQAGHAVAEFCLRHAQAREWDNQYLIFLEVYNQKQLEHWKFKFEKRNIDISLFKEPDINNVMTAFCGLIDDVDAGFLGELQLLT